MAAKPRLLVLGLVFLFSSNAYGQTLPPTICSEWNGFFPPISNIMEHINTAGVPITVVSTLYDSTGASRGQAQFTIPVNGQFDLLVHEIEGWQPDRFGKICSTAVNGSPGSLNGRMIYYRAATGEKAARGSKYDYTMIMPFSAGISGPQYVTVNTFTPKQLFSDPDEFVANWVHIRSLENSAQTGTLQLFADNGTMLASIPVTLQAGDRIDFAAHEYGQSKTGYVAWMPDNLSAKFVLRNQRYFYNGQTLEPTFAGGLSLDGIGGGEDHLHAIGAGNTIEISNTLNSSQNVSVRTFQDSSNSFFEQQLAFEPHQTIHVQFGSPLTLLSSDSPGIVAFNLGYETRNTGLSNAFGQKMVPAVLSTELRGSFNRGDGQRPYLILANPTAFDLTARIFIYPTDGHNDSDIPILVAIPRYGAQSFDLTSYTSFGSAYGQVVVRLQTPEYTFGQVSRGYIASFEGLIEAPLSHN